MMDSSVLNLLVSTNYVTFLVLEWKSSIVNFGPCAARGDPNIARSAEMTDAERGFNCISCTLTKLCALTLACLLVTSYITRRALGRAHVPPTKLFGRLAVNKTILKPRVAAATDGQYVYVGFSRRNKIPRCSAYTISEKAIRFRHPDYNPDRAQKLISSSTSRYLSTRNISSKSTHAFLTNFANRQTDKRTRAKTFTSSFVGGNYTNYAAEKNSNAQRSDSAAYVSSNPTCT